jgi:hypothetical protein
MRRHKTLLLVMISFASLGIAGLVLHRIRQNAGVPFLGARVVLDDDSWKARMGQEYHPTSYRWSTAGAVLYLQKVADKWRIVRQPISPQGKTAPPEFLPMLLKDEPEYYSLSPDGTSLIIGKSLSRTVWNYTVFRIGKTATPLFIISERGYLLWSPDSKFLYGLLTDYAQPILERYDTRTGAMQKTLVNTTEELSVETITPEGKLLCFDSNGWGKMLSQDWDWSVSEVQGKTVMTRRYQGKFSLPAMPYYLSPDGKRILWRMDDEEITWLERMQKMVLRKAIEPRAVTRWLVTDVDGKNRRVIGSVSERVAETEELFPYWTPDGKGVHFVMDKKLMYLPVP